MNSGKPNMTPLKRFTLSHMLEPELLRRLTVKTILCAAVILLCAMLQSTVFAEFRPFGAIPDLMIIAVVSIAMARGERMGAVAGIAAGYLIDALCGTGLSLSPLIYMLTGAAAGVVTRLYLTDSLPVFIIYVPCAALIRALTTLIYINAETVVYDLPTAFTKTILPEIGATIVLSPIACLIARAAMRPLRSYDRLKNEKVNKYAK